jgi:hypothetical protein
MTEWFYPNLSYPSCLSMFRNPDSGSGLPYLIVNTVPSYLSLVMTTSCKLVPPL